MNSQLLLAFCSLFYGEVSQVDVAFGFLRLKRNRENLSLEKDYPFKFEFSFEQTRVGWFLALFIAMIHNLWDTNGQGCGITQQH